MTTNQAHEVALAEARLETAREIHAKFSRLTSYRPATPSALLVLGQLDCLVEQYEAALETAKVAPAEPCAYPNDWRNEHDHSACLDA